MSARVYPRDKPVNGDLARSVAFHRLWLPMLGFHRVWTSPDRVMWSRGYDHFVMRQAKDGISYGPGALWLAVSAESRGQVDQVFAELRDAGAVILGKANLSEWANFRGARSVSGWSAVGGMVRNPHILDRTPCGSSAGSAVAVAAGLVAFAIGTETDGSVTCPAAMNGVVGLKPTLGLVSRTYIVPISPEQDTAGPMTRRPSSPIMGCVVPVPPPLLCFDAPI